MYNALFSTLIRNYDIPVGSFLYLRVGRFLMLWTEEENQLLLDSYEQIPNKQIAHELEKSITSVKSKAFRLGLSKMNRWETSCDLKCDTNSKLHHFLFRNTSSGKGIKLSSPLGDGCCLICFNTNPFERDYDHVFGRNSSTVIQLCPNCHRIKTHYPMLLERKLLESL